MNIYSVQSSGLSAMRNTKIDYSKSVLKKLALH